MANQDTAYLLVFAIYACASLAVFFILRSIKSTWAISENGSSKPPGFGQPLTLFQAAAEFLRNLCPQILVIATLAIWIVRGCLGDWTMWDAVIALAVLASWPFQEWLAHVFVLHCKPIRFLGKSIKLPFEPIVYKTHRAHHQNPWDPKTGLAIPHVTVFYVLGMPLFWNLFFSLSLALTATAVSVTLVLLYEWLHFLIHTAYKPRGWWYKQLWRHHRLHHFKNENYWFGVTVIIGDRLLRTDPSNETTPHSNTCMTLGTEEELGQLTDAT